MPDVSYSTLQSKIGEQQTQIQSSREQIQQQRTTGRRGIESLRRVSPKTPPSVYYGQIDPQIKSIRGGLAELGPIEKELDVAEQKLGEQQQLLSEKEAAGWKLRKTNGDKYEFYKEVRVSSGSGAVPHGDYSVRVKWRKSTGEEVTVITTASKMDDFERRMKDKFGSESVILSVESLGGGRAARTPEMRTTVGGNFMMYEAPAIVREPVKAAKAIGTYASIYEMIPSTSPIKKTMPAPIKYAERFGVPGDVFTEAMASREVITTTRDMTQADRKSVV